MKSRVLQLLEAETESIFLWGARQTGKSTVLKELFPQSPYIDLLKQDVLFEYQSNPSLFRERMMMYPNGFGPIIIDEIQLLPSLLNEVHWLMTNKQLRFIMSGSSARKLKRCGANLLGGRAISKKLFPFVSAEVPDFEIEKVCNTGMLPPHYLSVVVNKRLAAYVGDYLQEEIKAEAVVRNLHVFSRFLEMAAFCSGEQLNYNKIATDCGVSSTTIKDYFSILEETLVGYLIEPYTKQSKRRIVQSPRFYFFDVGVTNALLKRKNLVAGTAEFGKAFEHFVIQELIAYLNYSETEETLTYWRTSNGMEVDAVVGAARLAIEIKATVAKPHFASSLHSFQRDYPQARLIMVTLDREPRMMNGVEVYPVKMFLQKLWNKEF